MVTTGRKYGHLILFFILLIGVAVHLAAARILAAMPFYADELEYMTVGYRFAVLGELVGAGGKFYVHMHPPGYAAFVGIIYKLGGATGVVRVIQVVLNLFLIFLTYRYAGRAWGDRAAVIAAVVTACYLPAVFYATRVLTEVLFGFLLAAAVFTYTTITTAGRPRFWHFAGLGAILAAGALVRTIALPTVVVFILLILIESKTVPLGARLARAAALLAAFAVLVGCWSVYASRRAGHFVLLDAVAGTVLYIGNNDRTPYHHSWDAVDDPWGTPQVLANLPRTDVFAVQKEYTRRALSYIVAHPLRTAVRFFLKVMDLWEPDRLFGGMFLAGKMARVNEAVAGPAIFLEMAADAALTWLAVVGLILMPAGHYRRVLAAMAAVFVVVHGVTFGEPRYHVPFVMAAFPGIGYVLTEGISAWRAGRLSRGRIWGAAAATAFFVAVWLRMVVLFVIYRR